MSTSITYYIDAPSLLAATSVYSTPSLTFLAPDGFYSDGIISREQVGGVLLPPQTCPACGVSCDITKEPITANGKGVFTISVELGPATGIVVVNISPNINPVGIIAILGGTIVNTVYSPVYGYLSAPSGVPTYIGENGACPTPGSYPLPVYRYNDLTSSWEDSGGSSLVTLALADIQTTPGNPGSCLMIIPKTSATPDVMTISCYAICKDTEFSIASSCPGTRPLEELSSTEYATDSAAACLLPLTATYYVLFVSGTFPSISVNDVVFTDPNGQFPLSAGYYGIPGKYFRTDVNGIVIEVSNC